MSTQTPSTMPHILGHRKASTVPDVGSPNTIVVSDWNDAHIFGGNGTNGQVLVRDSTVAEGGRWASSVDLGLIGTDHLTYVDAVLEHGAKGDGIADDWQAITSAITSRKGPVYLRPGTYKISQTLALLDSTILLGAGTQQTIIRPTTAAFPAIAANNASYVQIRDLHCLSPTPTSGGQTAIIFTNVNFAAIERVHFTGHWTQGVWLNACNTIVIRGCFLKNVGVGVFATSGGTTLYESVFVEQCDNGFAFTNMHSMTCVNIAVQNFQVQGIVLNGGIQRLLIYGGYFANPTLRGVWLGSQIPFHECFFQGIIATNTNPIAVPSGGTYWLLDKNDLKTNYGLVWSPSTIRAWGQLSTAPQVFDALGIAGITRLGVGQARVTFQSPALFHEGRYAVNLTPINNTACIALLITTAQTYTDVAFQNVSGQYMDPLGFSLTAGGDINVTQ